jgi:hypothetical protein
MDGRKISLTFGANLRFGSLDFVYTGPAESVARRTFAWPPRPNVLTGAAGREAFVQGSSDEMIIIMLGPNQRWSILGSSPTNSPTLPSRLVGTSRWLGGVQGTVHRDVPPWIAQPPGRPGDGLHQQPPHNRRRPSVCDDSEGTDHRIARFRVGVQCLRDLGFK